jgi:DNA repair protein RadC
LHKQKSLISTEKVVEYLKNKIGNEKKEHFVILCLDTKNNIIYDEVSVGTLNASIVHPREVFAKAILHHANQIIVAHNHPSGDPTPSQPDLDTYRRLSEAGKLIGITLLNSYIITRNNFYKI